MYDLTILDAFSVSRHSESERFEPWLDLHNHQLLWHGSRVSNFVGILSQVPVLVWRVFVLVWRVCVVHSLARPPRDGCLCVNCVCV